MSRFARLFYAVAALAIGATPQAFAASYGIVNDGLSGTGSGHSSADWGGWTFSTAQSISVSALGMWAGTDNSVSQSHPLGIFQIGGSQVAGATISGSGDFANADNYIFTNLAAPVTLAAGTYFVGAFYNPGSPDTFLVNGDGGTTIDGGVLAQTFGPGITFIDNRVYPGTTPPGGFAFVGKSFLGGNFEFTALAVPEPETYAMLLAGLSFLGWQARRKTLKR